MHNRDENLLSEDIVNYKEILRMKAERMGVEYIDLESIRINRNAVPFLNYDLAHNYSAFPFDIKDNLLCLAMENPEDIFLIDEIKVYTQTEIKPFLADGKLIGRAIDYFYMCEAMEESAAAMEEEKADNTVQGAPADTRGMINALAKKALTIDNVSDIHIDPVNRVIKVSLLFKY